MYFKRKTMRVEVPTTCATSQDKQDVIDAVSIYLEQQIKVGKPTTNKTIIKSWLTKRELTSV
tara:strand:- start:606 stop:791 length:186 start_codon:yes stop_codon:yes gene_type:complete